MDSFRLSILNAGGWTVKSGTLNQVPAGIPGAATQILTEKNRAAAQKQEIAELRMRLLDLSNSNRLLNYKFSDRSRRHVRIMDELPDQILGKLDDGKRLVFKSLPELPDEPKDEKTDVFLLALKQAKRVDEEYIAASTLRTTIANLLGGSREHFRNECGNL